MFNALAHELQLSPAIADEIWCGARVDLMDLKLHAQEKLKAMNTVENQKKWITER